MDGTLSFELTGFGDAVKQYTLVPLQRKEAMWVMDTFLKTAAQTVGRGLDLIINVVSGTGGLQKTNMLELARSLGPVMDSLDFEKHWAAATLLFRKAVIRSASTTPIFKDSCTVEIDNFEEIGADYFRDNPYEYYAATLVAINENWPGFFTELRARLSDLKAKFGAKSPESKK